MRHSSTLTLVEMDGTESLLVFLVTTMFTLLFDVKMAALKKGRLSPRTLHHALWCIPPAGRNCHTRILTLPIWQHTWGDASDDDDNDSSSGEDNNENDDRVQE